MPVEIKLRKKYLSYTVKKVGQKGAGDSGIAKRKKSSVGLPPPRHSTLLLEAGTGRRRWIRQS